MAKWAHHVAFGRFQLDLTEPSLWAAGTRLATTPKQLAILVHLVRNAGRLVSKEELLASIWHDCHVIDSVVKTHIGQIRQVLGDTAEKPVFLVLDNCEHLVDGCAALTHTLLTECPNLRILIGSRERLRIAGETVSPLTPLPVPPSSAVRWVDLMGCESVRLFVDRAK